MSPRLRRIAMFALLSAGVVNLVIGLSRVNTTLRFVQQATSGQGQVVAFGSGGRNTAIRFTAPSGDVIDVAREGLGAGAHPGDTVPLLYLLDNPGASVRLNRSMALWLPGGSLVATGLLCLFCSGLAGRAARPGRGVMRGVSGRIR